MFIVFFLKFLKLRNGFLLLYYFCSKFGLCTNIKVTKLSTSYILSKNDVK